MGSAARRQRHKEELRQRILDTARQLIVEHGLESVTIRGIADAIEYSPTSLYLHFKDKESLIQELCHQDYQALARVMLADMDGTSDPVERLRQIGRTYVRFAVEHPGQYSFMFMTKHDTPPGEEALATKGDPREDSYAMLLATVQDAMDQGRLQPHYTNPHTLAQLFWGAMHGPIALQIAMADDAFIDWLPVTDTCEELLTLLLHGATRDPA